MAVVPNPPEPKKELRKLVCKECGCEIDDLGCAYDCKFDTVDLSKRDPATLEYHVYVFDRAEPYQGAKK
jgi:hypothetical protein